MSGSDKFEACFLSDFVKGTYGDIYNFPVEQYNKALDEEAGEQDEQAFSEEELDIDDDDGEEVEYVEGYSDDEDVDIEDCDCLVARSFTFQLQELSMETVLAMRRTVSKTQTMKSKFQRRNDLQRLVDAYTYAINVVDVRSGKKTKGIEIEYEKESEAQSQY